MSEKLPPIVRCSTKSICDVMDEAIGVISEFKDRGYSADRIMVRKETYDALVALRLKELQQTGQIFLLGLKVVIERESS